MKTSVLSAADSAQFVSQGFTVLRGAFSRASAQAVRDEIWAKIGLSPEEPQNWHKAMVYWNQTITGPLADAVFTPRLVGAFDDLMGTGRWVPHNALGWWPISFPGFESKPWRVPDEGWHVDGQHFHHHIYSKNQGLLPLFLFSDIAPEGGGTAILPGSHRAVAKILAEAEPEGLSARDLTYRARATSFAGAIELTGEAGDVALLHPFLLHARSLNTGDNVRFICNPCIELREEMNLCGENYTFSPVERAIVKSLG